MEEQKKGELYSSLATQIVSILGYDSEHPYIPKEAAFDVLYPLMAKENKMVSLNPKEKWMKYVTKDSDSQMDANEL